MRSVPKYNFSDDPIQVDKQGSVFDRKRLGLGLDVVWSCGRDIWPLSGCDVVNFNNCDFQYLWEIYDN